MDDAARVVDGEAVELVAAEALWLAAIPAPTFAEEARALALAAALREAGAGVWRDDAGNVLARVAGMDGAGMVAVVAHLDTVFGEKTSLEVRRAEDRLLGPGIGDNAVALAALLWLARAAPLVMPRPQLLLVATVGEEGLGDLRGARALAAALPDLAAAIVLEGHFLGRVAHGGPGARRLLVTARTPGGHSWQDHGAPSAIHALLRGGAALLAVPLPSTPRSTLNVGTIEGGRSVNTIADYASLQLDIRSTDEATLAALEDEARQILNTAIGEAGATPAIERIGQRPAAAIPIDHPLVKAGCEALRGVGMDAQTTLASTDANALLAAGIPSVTVGITTGANMHRLDEWVAVAPIAAGLRQLVALVRALAG